MPVVDNGREFEFKGCKGARTSRGGKNLVSVRGGNKTINIVTNRKARKARIEADLGLIQEHFGGISRSEAARLALSLTANAIRANKALPEV